MAADTSRDIPGSKPRKDTEKEKQTAEIKDSAEYNGKDRDLVHGDGGTLDIPTKPSDIAKDD